MMHVLVILVALVGSSRADPAKLTFPFPYPSAPLIPIAPLGTTFELNEVRPVPPLARSSHKQQQGESYGPSSSYVPPSSSGGYHTGAAPGTSAPGTSGGCATCKGASHGASHGSTSQGATHGVSQGISSHAGTSQGISSHSGTAPQSSNDPCNPTPCGPNTICRVDERDPYIAKCLCKTGFTPDGHTITGCLKLECTSDSACLVGERCDNNKCVDVCTRAGCGRNYQCVAENHSARCACYPGYVERAGRCQLKQKKQSSPVDPCATNPCGTNTDCNSNGHRAVCSCKHLYEGNPLTGCQKSECNKHADCPVSTHVCKDRKCINPCIIPNICGIEAICSSEGRTPICSCPVGRTGDPFKSCLQKVKICDVGTCARNAVCTEQNGRAVCSCPGNYIGDPLHDGCRPQCYTANDCQSGYECKDDKCSNPCHQGSCGTGAICKAVRGKAECSCPEHFLGNPFRRCYAECTKHSQCPSYKACYNLRCIDPCTEIPNPACGEKALCRVEANSAICSCPSDHTGHPYDKCRPFTPADLCEPHNPCGTGAKCTPGHDTQGNDRPVCSCPRGYTGDPLERCIPGECTDSHQCAQHESCYNYNCQDACASPTGSVCGTNAQCRGKNHIPVCSCHRGYVGNPLYNCSVRQTPRISVGRSNMMNMKNWKK